MGNNLLTTMGPYGVLRQIADASSAVDSDLSAATGFAINNRPTGSVDLQDISGASKETEANAVTITLNATGAADGDTLTQKVYGISDGGPPQLICSIVWTIGTARADGSTATYLWADTAVATDTHIATVKTADSGNDRVACVSFDATGYKYLYAPITAQTGDPTIVTSLFRYW